MKRVVAILCCVAILAMVGTMSHGKPIVSGYRAEQTS